MYFVSHNILEEKGTLILLF